METNNKKTNTNETAQKLPKKLNKLGQWYYSKNREYWTVTDMKAVLK